MQLRGKKCDQNLVGFDFPVAVCQISEVWHRGMHHPDGWGLVSPAELRAGSLTRGRKEGAVPPALRGMWGKLVAKKWRAPYWLSAKVGDTNP